MKITALIPTKNRSNLLRRAIVSIQNQKYKDLVIYVRDNCSSDDTKKLMNELQSADPRINFISLPSDVGPHENFRQGLKNINTEYFSILSDDDYLHEDFYIKGVELLEKNPDAAFVVFNVDIIDINQNTIFNNDQKTKRKFITYYTSKEGIVEYLKDKLPYTWTGYIFRRKVAMEIDLGDFSDVGYGADIRFIWHAACRYDFIVTNLKGAYFTVHENSTSRTLVKIFDERFKFWWRNRISLIAADPEVSEPIKKILWDYYLISVKYKYNNFSHYFVEACNLISERLRMKEYLQLKVDYTSIRVFLPSYIVFLLKYIYSPLERYGLMSFLKTLIKKIT